MEFIDTSDFIEVRDGINKLIDDCNKVNESYSLRLKKLIDEGYTEDELIHIFEVIFTDD